MLATASPFASPYLQVGSLLSGIAALATVVYAIFHGLRQDKAAALDDRSRNKVELTSIAVKGQASLIKDLQEEVGRLRAEVSNCESERANDRAQLNRHEANLRTYRDEVAMLRRQLERGHG